MVVTRKLRNKKIKKPKLQTRTKMRVFKTNDYNSGDGMLTSVWGPALWHFLHTMSFNYPVNPTNKHRKKYKEFIISLQSILPCLYCRENLKKNLIDLNFSDKDMKNRETFSKFIYNLHEHINKMLGKKSGLTYCDVRERYEHFRSRCMLDIDNDKNKIYELINTKDNDKVKEKGCTEPLYGKKSKCIINIIPQDIKCDTLTIDDRCIKKKI